MFRCQILCFILAVFIKNNYCDVVAYYENIILEGINASVEYTLPPNNFEEKPTNDNVKGSIQLKYYYIKFYFCSL